MYNEPKVTLGFCFCLISKRWLTLYPAALEIHHQLQASEDLHNSTVGTPPKKPQEWSRSVTLWPNDTLIGRSKGHRPAPFLWPLRELCRASDACNRWWISSAAGYRVNQRLLIKRRKKKAHHDFGLNRHFEVLHAKLWDLRRRRTNVNSAMKTSRTIGNK
jgi:hypothetical protein